MRHEQPLLGSLTRMGSRGTFEPVKDDVLGVLRMSAPCVQVRLRGACRGLQE